VFVKKSLITLRCLVIFFVSIILLLQVTALPVYAADANLKKFLRLGANRYEVGQCGELAVVQDPSQTLAGDAKGLAKQMLENNNIIYWTNDEGINTRDIVVALSEGKKAYTTSPEAAEKEVDINTNILKFILEAAEEGKIMVNALTDKDHSSTSKHYQGLAVDLDSNPGNTTVPVNKLIAIARKYGGEKNTETTHHHFDFLKRTGGEGGPEDGKVTNGDVYMVGDSITVGAKDSLESEFKNKNLNIYVNASGSRSISGPGQTAGFQTSGLQAVDGDKNRVKNADTVIVALGTNRENNFAGRIRDMVDKIRRYNEDAKIYWVNTFTTRGDLDRRAVNNTIDEAAAAKKFGVIDTVDQDIELSSDQVHPTAMGSNKFAKVVASGIEGELLTDTSDEGGQCKCGGVEGSLTGSENEEKIFNFLVGKGLSKEQAAGIVGNFSVESGFNPFAQEIGKTPPYGGYGIAQWTGTGQPGDPAGARRINMIKAMEKEGIKVNLSDQTISKTSGNDKVLLAQLEYMWKEATDRGNIEQIKQETTVKGAVISWLANFEIAGIPHTTDREQAGQDAIAKYGSIAKGALFAPPTEESSCATDETGEVVGEYSLPLPHRIYNQQKGDFSKPHHNEDPASDIPVPVGTPVFSMTNGTVIQAPTSGECGTGIIIESDSGAEYTYCHGTNGGSLPGTKQGDRVKAGQRIMSSGNTGSSTGPHLHLQIRVGNSLRCPQKLFAAIAEGKTIREDALPTSGCTS
jgi:murein DD-endopeptidase MepM/ murein hydrolase activator NlpD